MSQITEELIQEYEKIKLGVYSNHFPSANEINTIINAIGGKPVAEDGSTLNFTAVHYMILILSQRILKLEKIIENKYHLETYGDISVAIPRDGQEALSKTTDAFDAAQHTIDMTKKYNNDKRDISTPSKLAAAAILDDCLDRRGIKWEFEKVDDEIIDNILDMWSQIIEKVNK